MGEYEKMNNNNNKGKGIAVKIRVDNNQSDTGKGDDRITRSIATAKFSPRNASSKYDFVKVKVWLGDNADHYYVLSRFLLSRMLTVTKIPNHVAVKISLELKKLLIDNSLLDISQSDLEANLFKLMEWRGYGQEYISRYKMMTRFHHQRVPLVILVCGTACVGKSTIATQLAQRLNLPNVLQTDMVYELLRTATDWIALCMIVSAPLASTPVWARDFSSSEELITEFCRECRIVRKGLNGDLKKAMKDGKPVIIEVWLDTRLLGIHLDPSIYLMNDELKAPTSVDGPSQQSVASDDNSSVQKENNLITTSQSNIENGKNQPVRLSEGVSADNVNKVSESVKSMSLETASDNKGETVKVPEVNGSPARKEKSGPKPIIIPIVLKMSEFDHKALLEERITTQALAGKCLVQNFCFNLCGQKWDTDNLITNLKTIQNYLCSFKSQGLTVVNLSATTFSQTLDWLHGYILQSWDEGMKHYGS
ncbi:P-loop containing nucleoside triphosphate hydrolases superfamily protein isoform 1 [Gossypium australe]|uniref:P-loop containing nucleoside triphosphate hydrolases superfamily protein isoform 1 n=1 Tax=Gossypium australe TaxID=47621 RepID=A0A5B6UTZ6_9ROSI|nr:P-loop containing nucleoside triphosphate hydrolases superfamily protein isoform 1 [Gossypium australe]